MRKTPFGKMPDVESPYELPDQAETRDGYVYRPGDDHWPIVTDIGRLNFHFGDLGVAHALKTGFKGFVTARLRSENPRSVYSNYQLVRGLLLHIATYDTDAVAISSAHLMNYSASFEEDQRYRATEANDIVRVWARLGIPAVSREAFVTATDMPKSSRKRALAVRMRCPIQGAYTNLEYDGLYKALHAAFAAGEIAIDNYGLCLLSGAIGPRPVQIAGLTVGDLKVTMGPAGKTYVLAIPRAKQRGARYRTQFTERPLIEEIGMIIEAQSLLVREKARLCGMADPNEAPLFPAVHVSSTFFDGGTTPARPTPASIAMRIINVMEGLGVNSERTGEAINVNATRARRTVGTRAAQEGKSLDEIMVILDHTSRTAAQSYIEVRSDLLQRLDKKLAILLAPMAQRFAGTLAARGNDVGQGIERHILGSVDEGEGPAALGGCGKHGFCGLGKPIACYTCRLFHPWLDGPHEEILDWLLGRRRQMAEDGSMAVAVTLDDTIVACAEVVRQCRARAASLEGDRNG
ncbi:hypothetical protein [Aureimonas jatrophae]|uniref:Phage integrase family protein n=1 Tax=Aureimonas jatrophae TaxID=1166073 RepID=A0A1H0HCZ1_9HYPH|nr:hypothetical protein [Aureimonas jatrophae]MBB3950525.1 hypothetical protein [Aureimonas jatrophae]SDO16920.1 hypothetical protein SAMN05192530_10434 [Aureimonas jatrophae]